MAGEKPVTSMIAQLLIILCLLVVFGVALMAKHPTAGPVVIFSALGAMLLFVLFALHESKR